MSNNCPNALDAAEVGTIVKSDRFDHQCRNGCTKTVLSDHGQVLVPLICGQCLQSFLTLLRDISDNRRRNVGCIPSVVDHMSWLML